MTKINNQQPSEFAGKIFITVALGRNILPRHKLSPGAANHGQILRLIPNIWVGASRLPVKIGTAA